MEQVRRDINRGLERWANINGNPEQKPDEPQEQPTETPVPTSTGIGSTPPDINNANVPSAGNADTVVQSSAATEILSAKNIKKNKAVIKRISKNKYTINRLKKKKVYYIRLRAYKVVNGVKLYGSWSNVKKVKIKK